MAQAALQIEDGKFGGVDLIQARIKADHLSEALAPKVPDGPDLMKHYQPMRFKKKKLGKVEIKPTVSQEFVVVNMRNAYLLGLRPMTVRYDKPVEFNMLYNGVSMLTSDRPVEIHQQYISFHKAKGHVLVGGLGLGMAATMILNLPEVKSVTVVEKNKTIINLIQPQIDPRIKVVHADLYKFLETVPFGRYDFAYYDIWYSCGERDWVSSLVPLYRLSQKAGIENLAAWGEFEMQAQLRPALFIRALLPREAFSWQPYQIFIDAAIKLLGQKPPFPESSMPEISKLVQLYLTQVGTKLWEDAFDWPKDVNNVPM
jgi:hypothetical protein